MNRRDLLSLLAAAPLAASAAPLALAAATEASSQSIAAELNLTPGVKDATPQTAQANEAMYDLLDFSDRTEAECAARGLLDTPENLVITNAEGGVVWNQAAYSFVDEQELAPATVNPSLWENTRNNHVCGLFEVVPGIYQVRGYDLANLTLIEGETGWIVFDPLMGLECCTAAMQLVEKNLGKRPVRAIVVSHPHADHYGGLEALVSAETVADAALPFEEQAAGGKIPVIVPQGFTKHASSENLYAGKGMMRRANYQYGVVLEPGVTGKMAMGIGMTQSTGTTSFVAPSYEVARTGETLVVDGVAMEFQLTPGTEAPAEMNTWFPQLKALWVAENCTSTLHNLYTLRGAQIRDGAAWASYITEAIVRYGAEVEVTFQSHNWPHWGNELVNEYLVDTAAIYKFINDQTLTYINQGYTPNEISDMIKLPAAIEKNWHTRQYYGTVKHNAKAVYQRYMGWYDANPAHLDALAPTQAARKWVEYLGDVDAVLRRAKADFDAGEYRWVAEITNVLVFADPSNAAARMLCADAMEQLGYQSESGTWRNAYLSAALELREGNQANNVTQASSTGSLQRQIAASMIFDYCGIMLDKAAMADYDFKVNFHVSDTDEHHMLRFKNGVVLPFLNYTDPAAELTVTSPKTALLAIFSANRELVAQYMQLEGDAQLMELILSNMNQVSLGIEAFNIVEP